MAAGIRALLAMALLMPLALFCTLLADFGTVLADQIDKFAFAPHEIHRQATNGGAIPIQ